MVGRTHEVIGGDTLAHVPGLCVTTSLVACSSAARQHPREQGLRFGLLIWREERIELGHALGVDRGELSGQRAELARKLVDIAPASGSCGVQRLAYRADLLE